MISIQLPIVLFWRWHITYKVTCKSTCLNSSIGRDKAGVPLRSIAYCAFWNHWYGKFTEREKERDREMHLIPPIHILWPKYKLKRMNKNMQYADCVCMLLSFFPLVWVYLIYLQLWWMTSKKSNQKWILLSMLFVHLLYLLNMSSWGSWRTSGERLHRHQIYNVMYFKSIVKLPIQCVRRQLLK